LSLHWHGPCHLKNWIWAAGSHCNCEIGSTWGWVLIWRVFIFHIIHGKVGVIFHLIKFSNSHNFYVIYFFLTFLYIAVDYFWVSASDKEGARGQFAWLNGGIVSAKLWGSDQPVEPDTNIANQCVDLGTDQGKLVVNDCETHSHVLCEVPLNAIDCFKWWSSYI